MESLREKFFDEPDFGSVSISDLNVENSMTKSSPPEEWTFVRARTQTRDVLLYSEGIYKVIYTKQSSPLTTESVETVSVDEIVERMPKSERENKVVPSPSGEYITVAEIHKTENEDGTIGLGTTRTSTIPVEFVKEQLTYDEVIVELID